MSKKVAAIFSHPDDEVLGCGAGLAWHAAQGDEVKILLLATGLEARSEISDEALRELRDDAERAAEVLGARSVEFCDFPDNAMETIPLLSIVQRIEAFLEGFPADIVYTHFAGDLNIDHQVTNRAVMTACRPIHRYGSMGILACEVNSSTEWAGPLQSPFVPTEFFNAEAFLETKIKALECYKSEIRPWPHPRSSEGLRAQARWRGTQCGVKAAEAYSLMRRIR